MKKLITLVSAITLFVSGTTASVKGTSTNVKADKKVKCEIDMTNQVISYLRLRGYTVYAIGKIDGTQNFKAYTRKCKTTYLTRVFIIGSYIVGHEDVPI